MLSTLKTAQLKPETRQLLKRSWLVLCLCYAAALLIYRFAGAGLEYQQALILSEGLATGIRGGFGLLCLGFLLMECKE